ncbi:MAG TPA: hypothetical protein PK413_14510 [Thermoanaerobaculia bacterium]|nr:hypothetical protein [Thermoanaerobaculia bacterium]
MRAARYLGYPFAAPLFFSLLSLLLPRWLHAAVESAARSPIAERSSSTAVVLGKALSKEQTTADGVGRFQEFEQGAVYWTPETGARVVAGTVFRQWRALDAERGPLGYPVSEEQALPGGGHQLLFQHGLIESGSAGARVHLFPGTRFMADGLVVSDAGQLSSTGPGQFRLRSSQGPGATFECGCRPGSAPDRGGSCQARRVNENTVICLAPSCQGGCALRMTR